MALPERKQVEEELLDPTAVSHAYRRQRARRHAREQGEPVYEREEETFLRPAGTFWAIGGRLTWVAGLVLALSSFTDWYAEKGVAGPTIAVIGWHTGALGKLVFFIGLVLIALAILS